MKERVVLSDDLGTWTGPGSRVARDAGPKRGGASGADAPGRAVAPGGDDPVGALDVGSFVEAVRDRVCDVPRQQSEYPARRRGTSKVAARVLWRALRRANADRSRSIGVRREPQGWWRRPRRWYQDSTRAHAFGGDGPRVASHNAEMGHDGSAAERVKTLGRQSLGGRAP